MHNKEGQKVIFALVIQNKHDCSQNIARQTKKSISNSREGRTLQSVDDNHVLGEWPQEVAIEEVVLVPGEERKCPELLLHYKEM